MPNFLGRSAARTCEADEALHAISVDGAAPSIKRIADAPRIVAAVGERVERQA